MMAHPLPWIYKPNYSPGKAAIVDAKGNIVVSEGGAVSNGIFDMVWAVYYDLLRECAEEG